MSIIRPWSGGLSPSGTQGTFAFSTYIIRDIRDASPVGAGVAVLRSSAKQFRRTQAGCRAGFTIPVRNGQSRPVTEHRPPAWGQQVLQGDYWVQIPGTVHRQTSIQSRCRSNFAVPVSQMSSVMQQENRAGATMTPALNQRPWSTSRRFTPIRRWAGGLIRMIPAFGLRSSVVPEFPAGPLRGQCAVPVPAGTADSVAGERYPRQDGLSVKPDPLANQLPRALRHSGPCQKA